MAAAAGVFIGNGVSMNSAGEFETSTTAAVETAAAGKELLGGSCALGELPFCLTAAATPVIINKAASTARPICQLKSLLGAWASPWMPSGSLPFHSLAKTGQGG